MILSSKDDNILFLGIEFRPVLVQGRDDIQFLDDDIWTMDDNIGRDEDHAPPVFMDLFVIMRPHFCIHLFASHPNRGNVTIQVFIY